VAEAIRHALADVLARGEVRDPALEGVPVTVAEVKLTPDLRHATVFVLPLGGDNAGAALEALNRAAPFLASLVAKRVATKFVPRYHFRSDERFAEASRIETLLASPRVAGDLKKK
jgi:ribosome-binding factor A